MEHHYPGYGSYPEGTCKTPEAFITHEMESLNTENLIFLLTLLNKADENDLLMKAKVLRNLGRFEESRLLLDKVKNPDLIEVKEKFLAEINNKNKQVFQLF